jgi:hypothetical protein
MSGTRYEVRTSPAGVCPHKLLERVVDPVPNWKGFRYECRYCGRQIEIVPRLEARGLLEVG